MKKILFKGSGTAIITPMNNDGSINFEVLGQLIDFQLNNQTDAIIICGTTGEASTLDHQEHMDCISYTVDRVAGKIPVIAGTGSNDTAYSIKLSREAISAGVDGVLSVTPYYNKTSQAGLIAHFTTIADAIDVPMILYNVPTRTGTCIKPETYLALSKHPNIVAAKEASGNFTDIVTAIHLCGENLNFYSGNDDNILPLLSVGGIGVISVLSNIMPKETHDICQLYFDGKVQESCRLQIEYVDLINALFCDVNPIPVKEAINLLGFQAGPCRLPLVPMSEKGKAELVCAMRRHGLMS